MNARGADIEVIERRPSPFDPDSVAGSSVAPNEVRINGQAILIPEGHPVKVHDLSGDEMVVVTVTMFARSVSIRAEADDPTEAAEIERKRAFLRHLADNHGAAPAA